MLDSFETLLTVLRRSGLLTSGQVEQVAERIPDFATPEELGTYLVSIDWITAYQLQLLLAGQWDEMVIGPYQILDRIGEGGMSEVFKAWDTLRGREVALKVLRQDLASNQSAVKQFHLECNAIMRLTHHNIIKTYEADHQGNLHYFAMEYVEGMDLHRYSRQVGQLPVELACDLARQAAQGLQHAHQFNLVHRDIKPANLFLLNPPFLGSKKGHDPLVKIIDWGLARCTVDGEETSNEEKGRLLGSADFIAPEQADEASLVDIRADIYSLGCSLYFLLTATPPFPGNSIMQKVMQHRESPPPPVRKIRSDVCEELEAFLLKMMAKNPDDRPQIPLLIVAALRKFANGKRGGVLATAAAPSTALNLPRPQTRSTLTRPETHTGLNRPK